MNIQLNVDKAGLVTVFRTAAALLLGNSIVIPVLTEGRAHYWWVLLAAGIGLMIVTNIKIERKKP